ncbi:MAG: transporter substrate-binding domain-containing protein [Deltaproteobacteria bacterium]|nr:transporter substrate-binding domain-containing protein [Deltaproteobacteria bacterium]
MQQGTHSKARRGWHRGAARTLLLGGLACFFGLAAPALAQEKPLAVLYFPRPPLYVARPDGTPGGLVMRVAVQVLERAGIPHYFQEMPAKRIVQSIKHGDYACGVGWFRTPEREAFANFSRPLFQDQPLVAVVRKAAAPPEGRFPSLAALLTSARVMGVIDGFSYGPAVDPLLAVRRGPREVITGPNEHLLAMILDRRADYCLINPSQAGWLLAEEPRFHRSLAMVPIEDAGPGNYRYLMCSKAVPPEIMERLNRAVAQVTAGSRQGAAPARP